MKAVICKAYGPPEDLVVEEVADPTPGAGQVLVKVAAASVNFPDVLIIQNKYQMQVPPPFSPGGEISGEVIALGEGVTQLQVGARVIGSCGFGGFAEKTVVDATRCQPVPEGMDITTAAAFLMAYGTSMYALKDRAELKAGENLLVMGAAGGIGLAAVEIGKVMGARVIAATSSEEKNALCREHGADETILYPTGKLSREQQKEFSENIKSLTGGQGADVVYDPVGGDYSEPALRATNWGGRFLVLGFAAGEIPRIPLNLALLKVCQIVGSFWGAFTMRYPERNQANFNELAVWYGEGKIKPYVSKTYSLEETSQALQDMAARKVKGKIVVLPKG